MCESYAHCCKERLILMKILGFIPARGGSKRIKDKNLHLLDGQPLIQYTIDEALKSQITRLVVSTDSKKIADICKSLGAEVPCLRPKKLAGDKSIIEDAIKDMLRTLEDTENYIPDIIVLLHPTTPLRKSKHIDDTIEMLISENVDSVISVSEPMEHPGDMVYWDTSSIKFLLSDILTPNSKPGFMQSNDFPDYYFMNGVVYTFTYDSFKDTNSRYGIFSMPYRMCQRDSIDIDSMDDMIIAEALLKLRESTISEI